MGKRRDPQYVKDQLAKQQRVVKDLKDLPKLEEEEGMAETATQTEEETTNEQGIGQDMGAEIEAAIAGLGLPTATVVNETEETVTVEVPKADLPKKVGRPPKGATTATKEPHVAGHLQEGHCRVCGKNLVQEKSVTRGIGPVCFSQMKREFSWDDKTAKEQVATATDEEWTKLIEQVRELLASPTKMTEVPEGYVEMSKWWREAEKHDLSGSAIKRAVGGDRALDEPLDTEFKPVYVQVENRVRKYLPGEAMREEAFEKIRASQKPRALAGAAKAAKEKKEAAA